MTCVCLVPLFTDRDTVSREVNSSCVVGIQMQVSIRKRKEENGLLFTNEMLFNQKRHYNFKQSSAAEGSRDEGWGGEGQP